MKEWPRLHNWLDESRSDVRMQRILGNAAKEWLGSHKDPSFLLRGSRLFQFEGWVETNAVALTKVEKSFLEASLAARKERKMEEKARRDREQKQVSIGLAAQALQELEGPSPERSVLLALEAIENYPYTWQAERALGKAVLENRLCMILEHDDEIKSANWSMKGDKILTSGDDGTIRLWNSKSGQEIMLLDEGDPCLASWSPDNKSILAITKTDEVQVWDVDTGVIRITLTEEDIGGVYEILVNDWLPWSNSSKKFLTATNEGVVSIWDALSGHQLQSFHCHNRGKTLQAMWSPNDQLIASSSMLDGIVNILNIDKGEVTQTFYTDFEDERAIIAGWSPDGLRLAVRGLGGVKIYEVASGKQTMELTTSGVWNFRAIWSPSGDQILTSGLDDGAARIWDTESGEEINRLTGLDQARASAWSPDGSFVVVAGDDALIHLWDPHKDRELKRLSGTPMIIFLMAFSPNGNRFLAVGGRDNHLQVYKLSEASPQLSLPTPTGNFSHISWSSNGRQIALISYENKQPNIWDSETGEKVMTLNGHGDIAGMIVWSLSGDRILTTCEDGIARIWDGNTGEELLSFRGHQSAGGTGSWSPDGSAIVSGEENGIIIIWDSSTGREILTFREHDSDIWQALWSPDGNRILSTDNNGQAYIWEASTGEVVFKFFPDDHQLAILAATWTKDGQKVILQSIDRTIHIFDTSSGEKIQQYIAPGYGHELSISPSNERILIGCLDGTARVLDTSSGKELLFYDVGGGLVQAAYSPDGKRVLIGTYAGDVMIFPTWHSTEELIDYAKESKVFRQLTAEEREIYGISPL